MNDAGTAAVSEIGLKSVQYNPATKRLHVTTAAGNADCGTESNLTDLPVGALGLVVDDGGASKSYALRTALLPAGRQPIQYLLSNKDWEVLLNSTVTNGAATLGCVSNDQTSLKLRFDDRNLLSVAEQVNLDLASKTFHIRVTDPVLCHAYNGSANGLKIALTSPAEANAVVLPGYPKLDYELGGKVLHAFGDSGDGTRSTQCLDLISGSQVAAQGAAASSDRIFGARFESNDVQADVQLQARKLASVSDEDISVVVTQPAFAYEIELVNVGSGTAGGVVLREHLPTGIDVGAWTCKRFVNGLDLTGTDCATASGNGRLTGLSVGSLAPQEIVRLTLNRSVTSASEGQSFTLGAAAFVDPAAGVDGNFGNNADPLKVSVIGNEPPTFAAPTVVAYEDGDGADPQAPAQASSGIAVPLSFSDIDSAAVTITAATTNAGAGLPASLSALPTLTGNGSSFTGTLNLPATAKDSSGAVSVTLTVSDGSSSVQRSFGFDVLARNDNPDFALAQSHIEVPVCSGTCAETDMIFVSGVVAGPATATDEASQTVAPVLSSGRISCEAPPSGFFTFDETPTLYADGSDYKLRFRAGGIAGVVTCSITFRDSGTPAGETTKTFTIGYTSPPPTIAGVPTSDVAMDEDVAVPTGGEVLLTVTDPDGLQGSPTIASGSPGILGASLEATANPDEWRVLFDPQAEQNGSDITLTVTATDAVGSTATASFNVDVAAVNDAPQFSLSTAAVSVPACSPSAPCQHLVSGFLTNLAPGPAAATDEQGQAVEPVRDGFQQITCSNAPASFFGTAPGPQLVAGSNGYDLALPNIGGVSGTATCEVTVRETVETSSQRTESFTITYP